MLVRSDIESGGSFIVTKPLMGLKNFQNSTIFILCTLPYDKFPGRTFPETVAVTALDAELCISHCFLS